MSVRGLEGMMCLAGVPFDKTECLLSRARRLQDRGWQYVGGSFTLRPVGTYRTLKEAEWITAYSDYLGGELAEHGRTLAFDGRRMILLPSSQAHHRPLNRVGP